MLVLTSFSDRPRILGALEAGACGYLLKDVDADEVAEGIRAAARGESPLDPRAARTSSTPAPRPTRSPGSPPREREVLGLLVEGLPNKLIARRLEISEKTVKSHLTRIFRELGVTDRTQAALWAERNGVATSPETRQKSHCGRDPACRRHASLIDPSLAHPAALHLCLRRRCSRSALAAPALGSDERGARSASPEPAARARPPAAAARRDGAMRAQFEVDRTRSGESWRVVLVQDRRVAWRGRARTRAEAAHFGSAPIPTTGAPTR